MKRSQKKKHKQTHPKGSKSHKVADCPPDQDNTSNDKLPISLKQDNASLHHNKGLALPKLGRHGEANRSENEAILSNQIMLVLTIIKQSL